MLERIIASNTRLERKSINQRLIDTAHDPDLRLSYLALPRADQLARLVALQTGTSIVISRNGVVEAIDPATAAAPSHAQAAMSLYLAKR